MECCQLSLKPGVYAVQFGVLGPLDVHLGSEERTVSGARLRTLLAVLLLHANQPVPVDRLKEALWGQEPPATASASVHNLAARLRRVLSDGSDVRPRSTPLGYLLHIAEGELDSHLFESRLRNARAALGRGDWESVRRDTTAALALWRGVPLAELPDLADAHAPRQQWQEARLQALEWCNEAELHGNRPASLVPELTRLVEEHPLREAFHGQLMLALHHGGHRAEALAVYQRLRNSLRDELGIEPGPTVQRTHQQILRGEVAESPPAPEHLPTHRPTQLRSAPAYFVGRHEHLRALRSALTGRSEQAVLAVVTGMAGVGKTAIALRVAESVRTHFPDGQLFLNLRGATAGLAPLHARQALTSLLHDLGTNSSQMPEETEAASALLRSRLAGTRTLLVLDDAASAAQVRPLLPATPGCAALITSRSPLTALDSTAHIRLGPLSSSESVTLVELASGRATQEIDTEATHRLVELCGRLPLALRIATARLAARKAMPIELLVEQLTIQEQRLDHLEIDDLSVRQSLTATYDALQDSAHPATRDAAIALRRLGALHLPEYSAPLMAQLMDVEEARADAALNRLVDVALLEEIRLGRYAPHDLVRDFAHELANSQESLPERTYAAERAVHWYAGEACRSALAIAPTEHAQRRLPAIEESAVFATPEDALAWGDQNLANLVALAERGARQAGDRATLLTLVQALFPYLRHRGHSHVVNFLNETAIGIARECGDLHAEATALDDLAGAHFEAGRFEKALTLLDQASELWTRVGDTARQRGSLNKRGLLLDNLNRNTEAIATLERTLALSRECEDPYEEAITLSNLGNAHEKTDPRAAITFHQRSIEVGDRTGSPMFRCVGLCNIGNAHLALDEPADALQHFEAALRLPADRRWNTDREIRIGLIRSLRELHQLDRAEQQCQEFLDLAGDDAYAKGLAYHQYGLILHSAGDSRGALSHWRQASSHLEGTDPLIHAEVRALIEAAKGGRGHPEVCPFV